MSENEAVVKIIANHNREFKELSGKFKALMIVHTKTVNDFADMSLTYGELKKQNKDLRAIVVRWERDNKRLQESLDALQRELMDK